jgi:hypothetical protein
MMASPNHVNHRSLHEKKVKTAKTKRELEESADGRGIETPCEFIRSLRELRLKQQNKHKGISNPMVELRSPYKRSAADLWKSGQIRNIEKHPPLKPEDWSPIASATNAP